MFRYIPKTRSERSQAGVFLIFKSLNASHDSNKKTCDVAALYAASDASSLARKLGLVPSGFALALFLAVTTTLVGCSLSLTDHANSDGPAHVSAGGTGCLETALQTVEDYPNGKDTPEQVNAAWSCGINALDTFVSLAKGKDASYYSANSIRTFLEQNFLSQTKISDTLLGETMLLKQVFVGGTTDRLTHDEILKVRNAFVVLLKESLALLPHIGIITLKVESGSDEASGEKVEAAVSQLAKSIDVIAGLLTSVVVPYDLAHLTSLLAEIQKLYDNGSRWNGPQYIVDHIDFIYHAKAVLARTESHTISPDEWNPLFTRAMGLYSIYLRIHYLDQVQRLLSGDGLPLLQATVKSGFDLVDGAMNAKADHLIPYRLIDPLIDDVINLQILSWKVSTTTWKGLLRVACEKILNPPGGSGVRPERGGINPTVFGLARQSVENWLETQVEWQKLQTDASAKLGIYPGQKPIPLTLVAELWPQMVSKAPNQHQDLNEIFQRKFPIVFDDNGSIVFESDRNKVAVGQNMFDSINWKQSFIRGIEMGYSSAPELNRYKGLSCQDFKNFYLDFRDLGVDLNLLNPDTVKEEKAMEQDEIKSTGHLNTSVAVIKAGQIFDCNDQLPADIAAGNVDLPKDKVEAAKLKYKRPFWSTVFQILNSFTLASDGGTGDGEKFVSFNEGVDFIAYSLSASNSSHLFYATLDKDCQTLPEKDAYGIAKWPLDCYRQVFKAKFTQIYSVVPGWTRMVSKFNAQEMNDFQKDFESAARLKGITTLPIESSDIDQGSAFIQYIESLFEKFDVDHSDTLSVDEVKPAFPLFRNLLALQAKSQDDKWLMAIFTYLLKYGVSPDNSLSDKIYFWTYWQRFPSLWKFEADRHQMVKIVGQLNKPDTTMDLDQGKTAPDAKAQSQSSSK